MISAKLRSWFSHNVFLKASGTLAGAAFFLKDEFTGTLHTLCLAVVGLGIFLGTWSTTTRAPVRPQEEPKP